MITYRSNTIEPLTHIELDENFNYLKNSISSIDMSSKIYQTAGKYNNLTFNSKYSTEIGTPINSAVYTSSIIQVQDPVYPDNYVLQITIGRDTNKVNGGYRTELASKVALDAFIGETWWYGFSFYLTNNWSNDLDYIQAVAQIHGNWTLPNGLSPVFAIMTKNSQLIIEQRSSILSSGITNGNSTINQLYTIPYIKNKWYTVVYRVTYSNTINNGSYDLWVDGTKVNSAVNTPNSYTTTGGGNYPKLGVYAWALHDAVGINVNQQTMLTKGFVCGNSSATLSSILCSLGVDIFTKNSLGYPLTYSQIDFNFNNLNLCTGNTAILKTYSIENRSLTWQEMDDNFTALQTAVNNL